jgi:hypothetical protein
MNSFNTFHSSITKSGFIDTVSFNDSLYENTGLYGEITWNDSGYYEGFPSYFTVNTIDGFSNITNLDSLTNAVLPLAKKINASYTASTLNASATIYHCQWTGYFKANFTGTWTFSLNTVNFGMLWIGDTAITNEKNNTLLTDIGDNIATTANINLINGKYYPIRITWGKRTAYANPRFELSVTRNGTTITNLTSYLYSAKPNNSTLIGIPAVFIKKNANTNDNLYAPKLFAQYTKAGYHSNDVDFVQNNPLYNGAWTGPAYVANIGTLNGASDVLSFTIPTGEGVNNNFSLLYTGYFKADFTGTFTFNILADDGTYLWIGDYAISGYATTNSVVLNAGDGVTRSGNITLVNGQYYPIRILYGQGTGPGYHTLSFTRNGQTITNWSGYTFHPITPMAGYPKMFIDDIIVIGADSPIRSYFNNYIINVPTVASFNTYAGNYAVTSSSIYFTDSFLPYNLFKGDNTFNGEYATFWHSASQGVSFSFKPITNTALNYSQPPYETTGIYVGGGNTSLRYSTQYYINGNTTATAFGEWVQIMVPYNMKLTSYSNRARYTNARFPIQYVILGSTDGSSNWYALDEVDIKYDASYVPLKKYTINTTDTSDYPYANNYYNFFRYVIKKTGTLLDGNRRTANENQWNLVGIKEPINPDYLYIGGKNSPINSYFTNYLVNVPTGEGVDKYAGSYEVTSSSYFNNGPQISKPFTVFKGDDAFENIVVDTRTSTYYNTWWGAGSQTAGYKPITDEFLGYNRNPYAVNGVYQNGGTAANTFSTKYYTTGNTIETANGEWLQINVPYNMRLISYNARSRFSDCRVPVKYVILGSNDGSSNWYALDVVNIGTWDNYIPLKNYKINTTTYSYANNYYSYFRYVIQQVDTSPTSTIATDKEYAHENQWNLVGIKETPNANVGKPIYIGANSPSNFTSYFTTNNVTVPSNFASPEYVGTYVVSESSASDTTGIAANLFRNDSTNNGDSYFVIWHSGYGGNARINGAVVNYDRQPYASNGVYQGTTTYNFATPYYKTSNSTYSSPGFRGEWVQIKLPFKMKLTGYSHRTRYLKFATLGRNPSYYEIFGSNDGIIWYIVDDQQTATTTLNTININTSAYPDAKHGYSYFRWVIQNVTVGSSVAGDVANENQWNLIGVRTT